MATSGNVAQMASMLTACMWSNNESSCVACEYRDWQKTQDWDRKAYHDAPSAIYMYMYKFPTEVG